MLKKQQLRRYKQLKLEINVIRDQLNQLNDWLTNPAPKTARPDAQPAAKRFDFSKPAEVMERIDKLRSRYEQDLNEALDLLTTIEIAINNLEQKQQLLLRLHYIQGKPWNKVAEYLDYSERQVLRIHGHILQELKK